jgi:hypothetical protein
MAGRRCSPRTHFCGFMLGHLGVVRVVPIRAVPLAHGLRRTFPDLLSLLPYQGGPDTACDAPSQIFYHTRFPVHCSAACCYTGTSSTSSAVSSVLHAMGVKDVFDARVLQCNSNRIKVYSVRVYLVVDICRGGVWRWAGSFRARGLREDIVYGHSSRAQQYTDVRQAQTPTDGRTRCHLATAK